VIFKPALWGAAGLLMSFLALAAPAAAQATGPQGARPGVHLGVATCLGSNCHGAVDRPAGSRIKGNEYVIWSTRDKHHDAYKVLTQEPALRMARALGMPDAAHQQLCLDCHADNVPAAERGPGFHIEDGVGCEACHGGASGWLGIHISGATHQQNVSAGLYPTEQPVARAERCLSCHFGSGNRFVEHRLYGAGHPRLRFELDTFTAIQPAHFEVTPAYVQRKGRITDMQVWGAGQAVAVTLRANALVNPKWAPHGLFPEFSHYDCQSCHHPYDPLHGPRSIVSGLAPGSVKLNDANALMLQEAAARVAPAAAKSLGEQMLSLDRASNADWAVFERGARPVANTASSLGPNLARHEYTREEMRAIAASLIGVGVEEGGGRFAHAEQIAMGLGAIRSAMISAGYLSDGQIQASGSAIEQMNAAFPSEGTLRADAFLKSLRDLQRSLGQ
jgi:hypothetical protein